MPIFCSSKFMVIKKCVFFKPAPQTSKIFEMFKMFNHLFVITETAAFSLDRAIPFEDPTPMEEGKSVTIPVEQTVKSSRKI